MMVYVNGTLAGSPCQKNVNMMFDSKELYIGNTSKGYGTNGTIDDVRIYDRALTVAEIQADMNGG
jgi:hypothetical protein